MNRGVRAFRLFLPMMFIFLIAGCGGMNIQPSPTITMPTNTQILTLAPSPTPTENVTPTPEPTLKVPVTNETPFPLLKESISIENSAHIIEIGHYGTPVYSDSFVTKDNKVIFIPTSDSLRVYSYPQFKLIQSFDVLLQQGALFSCSSDGARFAYAADKIYVKNLEGVLLLELEIPPSPMFYGNHIIMTPDGKFLLVRTTGEQEWESVWQIYDIDASQKLEKEINTGTLNLEFSPDGQKFFAYSNGDKYFASYQTSDWTYIKSTAFSEAPEQLIFSPDDQFLAILTNGLIQVFETEDFTLKREIRLENWQSQPTIIGFSKENDQIEYRFWDSKNQIYRFVDLNSGQIIEEHKDFWQVFDSTGTLTDPITIPDGSIGLQRIGYGTTGEIIFNESSKSFTQVPIFDPWGSQYCPDYMLQKVSPDQRFAICAEILRTYSGTHIYDLQNQEEWIHWPESAMVDANFSNDMKYLAMRFGKFPGLSTDFQAIVIYDLETKLPILQKGNQESLYSKVILEGPLAFSPDSSEVVYIVIKEKVRNGYELVFQFLDSEKGQKTHSILLDNFPKEGTLYEHIRVSSLAISPDNNLLAAGTEDGVITLVDIANQKILNSWQAHTMQVDNLLFSPDGTTLASNSKDGFMNIWGIYP